MKTKRGGANLVDQRWRDLEARNEFAPNKEDPPIYHIGSCHFLFCIVSDRALLPLIPLSTGLSEPVLG